MSTQLRKCLKDYIQKLTHLVAEGEVEMRKCALTGNYDLAAKYQLLIADREKTILALQKMQKSCSDERYDTHHRVDIEVPAVKIIIDENLASKFNDTP